MKVEIANRENFSEDSLKDFDRFQEVKTIYKLIDGSLKLTKDEFTDDWSARRKVEKAREILNGKYITYCAFDGGRVVGEIMLVPTLNVCRLIVKSFHVTRDMRRKGIGKMLFLKAKEECKARGGKGLYLSACPAEETIKFYLAMGCEVSPNPIPKYAEEEPCDIQLECIL